MKTTKIVPLAVVIALVAALPAGAGPRRQKPPSFRDCHDQAATIQIPRSQAESYLPEGFNATGGAAGQDEVVHVYLQTVVCGGAEPTLQMFKTYVSVDSPPEMKGETTSEYFVIDAGASGAIGDLLRKRMCLGPVLEDAHIEASQAFDPLETGPAVGTAKVHSPSLSASFSVVTGGTDMDGGALVRWFFENEAGRVDYYDTSETVSFVGIGTGEIVFDAQYRDLPLAAPATGLYRLKDAITFYASPACRASSR